MRDILQDKITSHNIVRKSESKCCYTTYERHVTCRVAPTFANDWRVEIAYGQCEKKINKLLLNIKINNYIIQKINAFL